MEAAADLAIPGIVGEARPQNGGLILESLVRLSVATGRREVERVVLPGRGEREGAPRIIGPAIGEPAAQSQSLFGQRDGRRGRPR